MAGSRRGSRWPSFRALGALGLLGSLTCSAAMVAAALGIGGAAAAAAGAMGDMAGMSDGSGPASASGPFASLIVFLIWAGPAILLLSLIAIGAATAIRRSAATGLVLFAGAGLFWGMYLQPSPSVMVASIGAGLAALLAAYAWANGALRLPRQRPG